MRGIELRKKYKEEENTKVEIAEVNNRTFINTEYVFWLEDMLVKNLALSGVSQQRELLLDFANKYWNPQENPDNFIKEEYIDDYLKSNNCG
tara:strand:- start:793 stop:1065 length:273 start_codon:yes stop_codon:yes gene_type:complete